MPAITGADTFAGGSLELSADQTQSRGLAATADAHDSDDLPPRNLHIDSGQNRPTVIGEIDVGEFDQRFLGDGLGH